jgi:hypothetical protein
VDPIRRNILATGVAAATMAATSHAFAQQTGQGGTAKFYEKGPVRIRYEEAGSGFPLLLIAGGGLNSVMAELATSPFNPIEEFKGEYRCIFADLRNANPGESTGPLEIDRPWDAYTDDHLGLMDHLESVRKHHAGLQSFRSMRRIEARRKKATDRKRARCD